MSDSPDLRALAAEAIRAVREGDCCHVDRMCEACEPCSHAFARAVLATVLPIYRQQVLTEAAGSLQPDIDWQRKTYGHEYGTVAIGRLIGMQDAQAAIRRLVDAPNEVSP